MRKDLRRRCEEQLAAIAGELPEPYSAAAWRDQLTRKRGRPINFIPCTAGQMLQITDTPGVHGYIVSGPTGEFILYNAEVPEFMVEHTLTHELCHVVLDHLIPFFSDLDPARVQAYLCRASTLGLLATDDEIEDEAEYLATAIRDYVSEPAPVAPGQDPNTERVYNRLAHFFAGRVGNDRMK